MDFDKVYEVRIMATMLDADRMWHLHRLADLERLKRSQRNDRDGAVQWAEVADLAKRIGSSIVHEIEGQR